MIIRAATVFVLTLVLASAIYHKAESWLIMLVIITLVLVTAAWFKEFRESREHRRKGSNLDKWR